MVSKGRRAWMQREKGDHPDSRTGGEMCRLLGISESTWKNWRRDGKVPPAAYNSPTGWLLWSAEQARQIITDRIEGRL